MMRLRYVAIFLLGLSANGFAQINPGMPSWVDDNPFALGGDVGHPALSGIDAVWLDGVLNQVGQITVNSHIILFHPRHGDLGVRKLESSGLTSDVGTLSTGLQYVLGLRSLEQPDANGVSQVVGSMSRASNRTASRPSSTVRGPGRTRLRRTSP